MTHDPNVYGYVNGKPVFSRDEFIYESRRRGPIEDDAELIAFAEKATSGWHSAGWSHLEQRTPAPRVLNYRPKARKEAAHV